MRSASVKLDHLCWPLRCIDSKACFCSTRLHCHLVWSDLKPFEFKISMNPKRLTFSVDKWHCERSLIPECGRLIGSCLVHFARVKITASVYKRGCKGGKLRVRHSLGILRSHHCLICSRSSRVGGRRAGFDACRRSHMSAIHHYSEHSIRIRLNNASKTENLVIFEWSGMCWVNWNKRKNPL